MEPKKLYKSTRNKMLCGVCGGIAEYFNIDPTLVRLGVVIFGLASMGTAFLAYFICAIVIPDEPKEF